MRRLVFLASAAIALAVIQTPTAQADLPVPTWAKETASVLASPASILATAPHERPLNVVVTKVTEDGPEFETVNADSVSEAKSIIGEAQDESDTIAVSMAQPVRIAASTDQYRSEQWALTTLRAETAWAASGGNGIKVAVVDTGVQADHPDLNGQVLPGYNAISGGTNATDDNGHGTHVSGIVAAAANNKIGIAGLARYAKILPVKVLDANGRGTTDVVARGIRWAADHGAKVINLSLAANPPSTSVNYVDPMEPAIQYAQSKNIVVVAAAGNDGCGLAGALTTPTSYPAADDGVIGVGSIDEGGGISDFSSCGSWVDVAAPGGGIVSTVKGSSYAEKSGTSMATPYVAAAAALAIAEIGPRWTQAGVQAVLLETATDRGASGPDDSYGDGLVNPVRMLNHINTRLTLTVPAHGTIAGSPVTVSGSLRLSDGGAVPGVPVTLRRVFGGTSYSYALTTDSSGAFSKVINLPHNMNFTASFAGNGSSSRSSATRSYNLVRPRWSYRHTSARVYVTNYSLYGQTLRLQKKSGSRWATVKSIKVKSKYWSPPAGKGTWRLYSSANSALAYRVSPAWKN